MPKPPGFNSSLPQNTWIKLADELQQVMRGRARLSSTCYLPRRFTGMLHVVVFPSYLHTCTVGPLTIRVLVPTRIL